MKIVDESKGVVQGIRGCDIPSGTIFTGTIGTSDGRCFGCWEYEGDGVIVCLDKGEYGVYWKWLGKENAPKIQNYCPKRAELILRDWNDN